MRSVVCLLALAAVTGCSTRISAGDYDNTCLVSDDCVFVADGDKCDIDRCGCVSAAINVEAKEAFDADVAALVCLAPRLASDAECLCTPPFEAVCVDGTCRGPSLIGKW